MTEAAANSTGEKTPDAPRKRGFFGRIGLFLRQVVDELRKVVTPTREELVKLTGIVLAFVILMILLVSLLDFVFGTGASFVFGDGSA
ncbi:MULTISPECIES: preprotein translocase subunit SecE [Micrococcaceae]|uniref:preprotein translocase subunit SecE n=1 Tax=Micrococcaceae TaxID=1268 RepID=UPI000255F372|nr:MULTISPECIES: preprotein translocase subunit SecE [unclassified Citricoccus]MBB5749676.1 preprotein translocase subunit SecE [Micrococcus sp. TA1]MCY1159560.1 secE [Citricoccus sp. WCRC_4]HRO29991.1 preprotein translocase subunit SecE [Citricoccus sp.]HRO93241.1 preprotein translocase subunit SecE [Citricoccus sp.]